VPDLLGARRSIATSRGRRPLRHGGARESIRPWRGRAPPGTGRWSSRWERRPTRLRAPARRGSLVRRPRPSLGSRRRRELRGLLVGEARARRDAHGSLVWGGV